MNQSKDLKDLADLAIQIKKNTELILAMVQLNSVKREGYKK